MLILAIHNVNRNENTRLAHNINASLPLVNSFKSCSLHCCFVSQDYIVVVNCLIFGLILATNIFRNNQEFWGNIAPNHYCIDASSALLVTKSTFWERSNLSTIECDKVACIYCVYVRLSKNNQPSMVLLKAVFSIELTITLVQLARLQATPHILIGQTTWILVSQFSLYNLKIITTVCILTPRSVTHTCMSREKIGRGVTNSALGWCIVAISDASCQHWSRATF